MFRDGVLKSIWQSEVTITEEIPIRDEFYDVVIVGAGITGFSCALSLQQAGKKCLLLEAENTGFGSTGGTSAHLNTFFDAPYNQVINDFGLEKAKLFAETGKEAIEIIKSNVETFDISCQYENKVAYLFATDEKQSEELDKIVDGAEKVGIQMNSSRSIPFPIPFVKAVCIEGQGQFHPIRYINGLRKAFIDFGGRYVEKCRVTTHSETNKIIHVSTSKGEVKTHHLIFATHTPPGINLLHFRNLPWRTYVLGIEMPHISLPQSLGYDLADPYHYYRFQQVDGKSYLIAGGKDHKTGVAVDTKASLVELEQHVRQFFDVKKIAFAWSSQYYEPADGLPYIGNMPGEPDGVWVATGYTGNGMIFGTMAGKIICDLIVKGSSEYKELFDPCRIKPIAGFSNFVSHNAHVTMNLVKTIFPKEKIEELSQLASDEGKVVSFEGNSYAIYKDPGGEIHALENLCPHTKCSVNWNNAELSWDCPCHGSRFGVNGNVLTAPSVKGLKQIDLE